MYLGSSQTYNGHGIAQIDPQNPTLKAYIHDDRTYVPLRFLTETYGGTVEWNQEIGKGQVRAVIMGTEIIARIGEKTLVINGKETPFDAAPEIRDERIFVPIRVFVEALGKNVFYKEGTVVISDTPFSEAEDRVAIDEMTLYLTKNLL
jgi:hypothetical protein